MGKSDQLLHQIVEAFWRWDPIGVAADREIAYSEYDAIAARVSGAVRQGRDAEEVEAIARTFVVDEVQVGAVGIDDFMAEIRQIAASQ